MGIPKEQANYLFGELERTRQRQGGTSLRVTSDPDSTHDREGKGKRAGAYWNSNYCRKVDREAAFLVTTQRVENQLRREPSVEEEKRTRVT